jgi:hypothetical protein
MRIYLAVLVGLQRIVPGKGDSSMGNGFLVE